MKTKLTAGKIANRNRSQIGLIAISRYPLVYKNVPKAACTSIKNILYELEYNEPFDEPMRVHRFFTDRSTFYGKPGDEERKAEIKELYRKRKILFTFVREPTSRLYSCFWEKVCCDGKYPNARVGEYIRSTYNIDTSIYRSEDYDMDHHRQNFENFLRFVRDNEADKTPVAKNAHWRNQSATLKRRLDGMAIDFIGRLERFVSDFEYVLSVAGVPADSVVIDRRYNEAPMPPPDRKMSYTRKSVRLINDICEPDFVAFGYPELRE